MNFIDICKLADVALLRTINLRSFGYKKIKKTQKYLYGEGNYPVMLVAHLDTVHKELPSIICQSDNGRYVMSPQGIGGDDRCGVYMILQLLEKLHVRPHVLFTMEEEIGGRGAMEFCKDVKKIDNLNFIVEFDRANEKDCVFYDLDYPEFEHFVEEFGFKTAYGSFTDISEIAPHLGVAAVNLSCGYFNPHTNHEYVDTKIMQDVIEKAERLIMKADKKYEYKEDLKGYSRWTDSYAGYYSHRTYDNFGYNYDTSKYDVKPDKPTGYVCPDCGEELLGYSQYALYGHCPSCGGIFCLSAESYEQEYGVTDKKDDGEVDSIR